MSVKKLSDYLLVQKLRCINGVSPNLCNSISGNCRCVRDSEKYNEIARKMMQIIMYDNGMVDRNHPEEYPKKWVLKISEAAFYFFEDNPKYLTDEDIKNICIGEEREVKVKYGKLWNYDQLDKILDEYHDH